MLLRHDVDLSLDAALRMAELEHAAGASATYFLMTESVFYNLDSKEGVAAIARLRELATASRSMPSTRARRSTSASTPSSPGTTPTRVHAGSARGRAGQRHAGSVVRPGHVPLGLEPALALRLPARRARRRRVPWLQLLTHPEIWAFPGETMGQTMRAMLDAERERRLQQLADDRIDLT